MNAQTEQDLDASAIARLNAARDWLLAEGIPTFQNHGVQAVKDHVFDAWTVLVWATPLVETKGIIAQFRIKARGFHYDIQSLFRASSGGDQYDFWVVQKSAADWATPLHGCDFLVTRAVAGGRREIMVHTRNFIPSFSTDAGDVLQFPQQDPAVLYDLRAWKYPECFEGSPLKDYEVLLDAHGKYITKPYRP